MIAKNLNPKQKKEARIKKCKPNLYDLLLFDLSRHIIVRQEIGPFPIHYL